MSSELGSALADNRFMLTKAKLHNMMVFIAGAGVLSYPNMGNACTLGLSWLKAAGSLAMSR